MSSNIWNLTHPSWAKRLQATLFVKNHGGLRPLGRHIIFIMIISKLLKL